MKIIVLNGSPKGTVSVTMQYVQYLQKKFPHHELKILDIAKNIKKLGKNEQAFKEVIAEIGSADGILWAFPVYIFLVPSQYLTFFELIHKHGEESVFKGKYTATLSTSAHLFDHTAHQYMNAVCDDLDMKFVDFYPAEIDDLLKEEQRKKFLLFAEYFFEAIADRVFTPKVYEPLPISKFKYSPGQVKEKIDIGNKRIVVLTDTENKNTNVGKMIERFKQSFEGAIEIYDLNNIDIKGGCLGCMRCWYDNKCAYKDGFISFYQDIMSGDSDAVIYAGQITNRYFSPRHKQFTDRVFFNHHKMLAKGNQVSYIVSGPESRIPFFAHLFQGFHEFSHYNYIPGVSDESEDSAEIDARLQSLADRIVRYADKKYVRPSTFLGVSAMKITRDLSSGKTRSILQDDYRHFKKNGYNDFPQNDYKTRLLNMILVPLTKIPAFRNNMTQNMTEFMIQEHQKVINKM